jgi:PncC family amidohydrolase
MEPLEERLKEVFTARNLTLATAESCTGGLLAGRITDVSGSSAYFTGGVVSYSYDAKEALLGVDHETLLAEGAVSEAVAQQMARGVRVRLEADVAVSVTGVAGPTGGTTEKPVGLTWIGLSDSSGERAERFVWKGDRAANREQSVQAALRMLVEWAEGADPQ